MIEVNIMADPNSSFRTEVHENHRLAFMPAMHTMALDFTENWFPSPEPLRG